MVAKRNVPIVAKLLKQHFLGLHGKRKGTIVAKFEKSHLWVILHAHIGLFPTHDIFSNEFGTCYHVAFVGSAQYSILQCLAQANSFFVKYAAGTMRKSTLGGNVSSAVVLPAFIDMIKLGLNPKAFSRNVTLICRYLFQFPSEKFFAFENNVGGEQIKCQCHIGCT